MVNREKFLDDAARLAGGAMGVMNSMRDQIRNEIKSRMDEMALKFDLVPRAEFERLEAGLQKARLEQEALKKRLDALEGKKPAATKPAAKKPAKAKPPVKAKKTSKKKASKK